MHELSPHLEILPKPQRRLWVELSAVPGEFTLYGGTALALHLGHRSSVDFDFFSTRAIDVAALESGISFLARTEVIQRGENTLSVIVDRGGPVKVSFFGVPKLPCLALPLIVHENGLKVASLLDLAGTKASVLQVRAEAKDYIDMDALIHLGGVGLPLALAAALRLYGPSINPEITLKALSYFDDGNLRDLPDELKLRLVTAVQEVDLDHLPGIDGAATEMPLDDGHSL